MRSQSSENYNLALKNLVQAETCSYSILANKPLIVFRLLFRFIFMPLSFLDLNTSECLQNFWITPLKLTGHYMYHKV